jgi:coenzyme F420-0:L-glutamate ligase/coenzyme F420-1:gamma-L-glutamate ligase
VSGPPLDSLTALAVRGLPEIAEGADLAALIAASADLRDGDVVVVTSKVVSKAEGRVCAGAREDAIERETVRVVARRAGTTIVRTRHGLTLAAAGVDASNTPPGTVVLLPVDSDASARRLRRRLQESTGRLVAVVVSDTAGRAWREGQTDLAVGVAGLRPLADLTGVVDSFGNPLTATAPAVADEVAALADLVMGKTRGVPVVVVRGLSRLVCTENGPGAVALQRPDRDDMFGLGSREAVLAAVRRDDPAALAALRRESVGVEELVRLAASADVPPDALRVRPVAGGVEVSGADDLVTSSALERILIASSTTMWRLVSDHRNGGSCRIVLRREDSE